MLSTERNRKWTVIALIVFVILSNFVNSYISHWNFQREKDQYYIPLTEFRDFQNERRRYSDSILFEIIRTNNAYAQINAKLDQNRINDSINQLRFQQIIDNQNKRLNEKITLPDVPANERYDDLSTLRYDQY